MRLLSKTFGRLAAGVALPVAVISAVVVAPAAHAEPSYTLKDISGHSSASSCWTAINGGVYDVTRFINVHEGGAANILKLCGIDGSTMFNAQHGRNLGEISPVLARYRIGAFDPTLPPAPTTTYTFAQVQTHKTSGDCWSAINNNVYNLTAWIPLHPGKPGPITALCGTDGTTSFNTQHGGSATAKSSLALYQIGVLTGGTGGSTGGGTVTPPTAPAGTLTLADVAKHASKTDCWVAINGYVYDMTAWKVKHPGGEAIIDGVCGTDGSAVFNGQHASQASAKITFLDANAIRKGTLAAGQVTTPKAGTYTLAQIKPHNTAADCWLGIQGIVYDLTKFIPGHSGKQALVPACGTEATTFFYNQHGLTAGSKLTILSAYKIGTQSDYVAVALPTLDIPTLGGNGQYTAADVAKHSTVDDCWSIVNDGVYNLTAWIGKHPGGADPIKAMCGNDGTASYNGKHGSGGAAGGFLAKMRIGTLVATTVTLGNYTLADVAKHASQTDCWSAINSGVYDLTKWIKQHPGGPDAIIALCGADGTAAFTTKHGGNAAIVASLKNFQVGNLVQTAAVPVAATVPTAVALTRAMVRSHNKATDCWTVVNRNVYNLTPWTKKHQNRRAFIKVMCGKDGSRAYNRAAGGIRKANVKLKRFKVGPLAVAVKPSTAPATIPTTSGVYTMADVATHASDSSCWAAISGSVYDLTAWIGKHPGGAGPIKAMCGKDGTASFNGYHKGQVGPAAELAKMKVGTLG